MAGIASYGVYLPLYRLSRAEIARAWGTAPVPGERTVANYDEDSLTMAVAAAFDCLAGIDKTTVDGLYFATTTSPYREKQTAALIAAVLGLPAGTATMDLAGSLRCGANALMAAVAAVESGAANNVLVCAADMRLGYPSGPYESSFGDGAVALLISRDAPVAEITHCFSRYDEIQDTWRADTDTFVRSAEDRFAAEEGFGLGTADFISSCLQRASFTPSDISAFTVNAPGLRQLRALTGKLRLPFDQPIQETLYNEIGDTGSAMSLLSLIAALEKAGPGEKLLSVTYGNGCDAVFLEAGPAAGHRSSFADQLASKAALSGYNRYLRWRGLVEVQPPARPPVELRQPSPAAQHREVPWELRLTGTRCRACGTPQYPPQRVCINCGAKDDSEPYGFADKPARVFSFSHDYVKETVDPPVTVTMVDFEGGGRLMCEMTDRDPADITVGLPVTMTFRKLYAVGGINNYWWKCRPLRANNNG